MLMSHWGTGHFLFTTEQKFMVQLECSNGIGYSASLQMSLETQDEL